MRRSLNKAGYLFVLFLALAPVALSAQTREKIKSSTPEQRADKQSEFLGTNLKLDDAQRNKISAINLKYAKQMDGIMKGKGSKIAKMKSARKLNEEKEAEYQQVMTPDQYKQYQQVKKDLREKMKEQRKTGQAPAAAVPAAAAPAK